MQYGIIKSVSFERGFGFIRQQRGLDVYFHATVVVDQAFERIQPDQPVKYELEKRDRDAPKDPREKGPRAIKVELIDRVPGGILAPPPPAQAPKHHPRARQRKPTWRRSIGEPAPSADAPDSSGAEGVTDAGGSDIPSQE
ncbi:cold-shock DNA-binding domain protein [Pirellula staleyi DSM 6068]|uniref:Cold-shock DNA-binding domain protein n=1 Tax=Pirellula staleyi (strain ATCC 27377 / DSM 6068 / ICPB 4128) TaxID=530564 RepID=D2R4Q3_PIRSD|nr:cold shock domain-containing protein [Pirellula staleyi]ADB17119.1 cold-shock DNA-binding domain protein [Pirellula staleyi DSM 6068]